MEIKLIKDNKMKISHPSSLAIHLTALLYFTFRAHDDSSDLLCLPLLRHADNVSQIAFKLILEDLKIITNTFSAPTFTSNHYASVKKDCRIQCPAKRFLYSNKTFCYVCQKPKQELQTPMLCFQPLQDWGQSHLRVHSQKRQSPTHQRHAHYTNFRCMRSKLP